MNISNQNSFCDKVQLAPGLNAASSRHFSVCWLMLVASTFAPNVVENTCQRTESWSQTFEHRHCEGLYEDPVHSIHFVAGQWFGACNSWGTAAARTLFCCPGQGLACSSSCNLAQMILLFEAPWLKILQWHVLVVCVFLHMEFHSDMCCQCQGSLEPRRCGNRIHQYDVVLQGGGTTTPQHVADGASLFECHGCSISARCAQQRLVSRGAVEEGDQRISPNRWAAEQMALGWGPHHGGAWSHHRHKPNKQGPDSKPPSPVQMESKCSELGAFEEAEMVVDRKPTRLRKPLQGHADRDRALTEDVFDFGVSPISLQNQKGTSQSESKAQTFTCRVGCLGELFLCVCNCDQRSSASGHQAGHGGDPQSFFGHVPWLQYSYLKG